MNKTNWNELNKIRLSNNYEESMDKHDVIKILLVRKILRNTKKKFWLRIYTEFKLENGSNLRPDIYVENLKEKSVICYEIQKELTEKYIKEKTEQYTKHIVPYMNTIDLIIIPLKECPESITEVNNWLEKYVVA